MGLRHQATIESPPIIVKPNLQKKRNYFLSFRNRASSALGGVVAVIALADAIAPEFRVKALPAQTEKLRR